MNRFLYAILGIFLCLHTSAWAVATVTTSSTTYQITEPTDASVTNWTSGWETTTGTTGITGWDYVGSIGGASAVYLGDGWVLTAAHVTLSTSSTFTLSGASYSISDITYVGTSDLVLFKISVTLSIPALTITGTNSLLSVGSSVVMIGNGGGAESWGKNVITTGSYSVTVNGKTTTDFLTKLGSGQIRPGQNYSNTALLVSGDSGGADYYYDTSTGEWVLVGINEVVLTGTDANGNVTSRYSGMVDLSEYADEISAIIDVTSVPEPSTWALLGISGALGWVYKKRRNRSAL
jgi:hypothetical protein